MANTVTQKTLTGAGSDTYIKRHIHISSDGTEESDLVIFDNSAFCADTSKGRLVCIKAWGASAELTFEWDQSTDAEIIRINPDGPIDVKLGSIGNASNPNGSGATGDILLSTANLDSGDIVDIIIVVQQA